MKFSIQIRRPDGSDLVAWTIAGSLAEAVGWAQRLYPAHRVVRAVSVGFKTQG